MPSQVGLQAMVANTLHPTFKGFHRTLNDCTWNANRKCNLLGKVQSRQALVVLGARHRFPSHLVMPIINDKSAGKHTRMYK